MPGDRLDRSEKATRFFIDEIGVLSLSTLLARGDFASATLNHQDWPRAEWHEVKLQYTAVSRLCMPLSMVGVDASMLGPACDGMGFDPRQSSCQKVVQGVKPSNGR